MEEEINEFLQYWKERDVNLPDPSNYPKSFRWYYMIWKLQKNK